MPSALGKLRGADFFRKLPTDLTEATLTGASLSLISTVLMSFLLIMEFSSFMALKTDTKVIVDRSPMNDLLRINFNMTFTKMTCEHLTLDVSDSLGSKKINLSKTVRKVPISSDMSQKGTAMRDETLPMPQYDEHDEDTLANTKYVAPMTEAQFNAAKLRYPLVLVNFYAPWCPYCQRLGPTWQNVSEWAHAKYPVSDGRIRLASIDCVKEEKLCQKEFITGFPSVRIYRKGSDKIVKNSLIAHEAYHGDRTADALQTFIDSLVGTADKDSGQARLPYTRRLTLAEGCQLSGFVLVKKVPGSLHFHMKSQGFSFETGDIDVSHVVHAFTFGSRPSPKRMKTLARLHPGGLAKDWADKLQSLSFISQQPEYTHEHFIQLIRTTMEPATGRPYSNYDAYEYTVHSHSYLSEMANLAVPSTKFTYHPSPMQVLVTERRRQWYHFLTTTCAIVGGVFTVCSILDGISFSAQRMIKKVELGKHS